MVCSLIVIFLTISFYTVNYCRNVSTTSYVHIELISYAYINTLVGVEKILEGYNLSLQVRIACDTIHYIRIHYVNKVTACMYIVMHGAFMHVG